MMMMPIMDDVTATMNTIQHLEDLIFFSLFTFKEKPQISESRAQTTLTLKLPQCFLLLGGFPAGLKTTAYHLWSR